MNLGELFLRLAVFAALGSVALLSVELFGRRSRAGAWAFGAHAFLLVGAFAILCSHFLSHRFQFEYVAQYSSRALHPALALAAVWAGQEGSILLWAALGALVGLALLRQPGRLARPALFFVGLAQIGLSSLLLVKSPFALGASVPADGHGLNPLLADPWMVVHPPVLFLGYAALVVPFALAAAALARRELPVWTRMVWPWALFGVLTLGTGIALGGVWAYRVLGWGGYWGWDPVENASLVPWLVAVALLHGLLIQRTTGSLARANLVLASLAWVTTLGGTYLTRSGVLQDFSVHSFADSGLNAPLLVVLAVFAAIPLALLVLRWGSVQSAAMKGSTVSRESALWLGMITVLVLAGMVSVGTAAPLLTSLFGKPAGVQPAFYSSVSLPIGIALVVLMGLSPALRWYRQQGAGWLAGLWPGLAGLGLVTGLSVFAGARQPGFLILIAVAGLALGVNAAVAAQHFRRGWMYGAGYLGHAGVAVLVLGMALSTTLQKSVKLTLEPGQPAQGLGYTLTYRGDHDGRGGDRTLDIRVEAEKWGLDARPALLPSPQGEGVIRKPAIDGWRELYLSPLEVREAAPRALWLDKNHEIEVDGVGYTFTGFRMDSKPEFRVYADLRVRNAHGTVTASPALAADASGGRPIPVEVAGLGSLSLARLDADRGRIALVLPGAAATVAIVELSVKPFINLVWIGALLTLIGTALAGMRRAAERATLNPGAVHAVRAPSPSSGAGTDRTKEEAHMLPHTSKASTPSAGLAILILVAAAASGMAMARSACADGASAASSTTTSAFGDTSKPVMFLKEVVVTGARYPRAYYESPQALSFLSRVQIRESAPTVLGDAIGDLAGADNSKDSPWEQRPVLRGLSGQRVLVMMDGMPVNSARGNGPHPSLVDPAQVERIEVVRGPSSVAYGSDALGGVINIITREAQFTAPGQVFRGSATLGGSTADRQRNGYLELMPRVGRLSAFLSSGGRKAEDFESPNGTVSFSSFSDYNALANLRYELTDHTALKGGYQLYRGRDIGIPGLSFVSPGASQVFEFPFYERDAAHLTLDHHYEGTWLAATRVQTYWQREHRDFFSDQALAPFMYNAFGVPPRAGSTFAVTDQDRYFDLDTWGARTQLTTAKTRWYRLSAGFDAARDVTGGDNVRHRTYHFNSIGGADSAGATAVRVTASVPDGRFDNYAGFVQGEYYLHPQWTVSTGGRFTHYRYRTDYGLSSPAAGPSPAVYFDPRSVDDDALAGSLGLVYAPLPDLHLSANVANGFREPNAQDLFFSGPASVGFVIGNPNLAPEKSVSYDLGLRWGPGQLALSGNLFYSTYRDLIDAIQVASVPAAGGQPTYQYVNISEARIWGGEAEAEWHFLPQWSARTTMSGAVGDITNRDAIQKLYGADLSTAPLPNVPPFKGTSSLRWTHSSNRFWVEPRARYSWRTNRLALPTPGVPQIGAFKKEWLVGDLFAGARVPTGQRLVLGVRNIGDATYRPALASLDEPGISFVGSLSTDF